MEPYVYNTATRIKNKLIFLTYLIANKFIYLKII